MTDTQKAALMEAARKIVETVNEAERHDPQLGWRPWQIRRPGDPR